MKTKVGFLIKSLFLSMCLFIFSPSSIFAAEPIQNYTTEEAINNINSEFEDIMIEANNLNVNTVTTDEEAYSLLLHNKDQIVLNLNKTLSVDFENLTLNTSLSDDDLSLLIDFVDRINFLITAEAITIDDDLLISFVTEISPELGMVHPRARVVSIMTKTRNNARTLKSVYNNAVLGTKHAVAGAYFAQRVKPAGIWDFKVQLGTNTNYTVVDLNNAFMSGEAIGNYHYGYVGRAVFSAATLKSAAGMVQIGSGTSSMSFWKTFFDDPRDQVQIQKGINKYNSEH